MSQITNKNTFRKSNYKLAFSSIITALSVVLVLPSFKIIPAAPFLEYNPSDIPILIASMVLGPFYGIVISIAVSAIQALTISAESGWYGFIMHVSATSILAFVSGIIFCSSSQKRKNLFKNQNNIVSRMCISLIIGGMISVIAMIPLNLIVTPVFMGTSFKDVVSLLLPAIIPFNSLKMVLNCVGAGLLFIATKPVLKNIGDRSN